PHTEEPRPEEQAYNARESDPRCTALSCATARGEAEPRSSSSDSANGLCSARSAEFPTREARQPISHIRCASRKPKHEVPSDFEWKIPDRASAARSKPDENSKSRCWLGTLRTFLKLARPPHPKSDEPF